MCVITAVDAVPYNTFIAFTDNGDNTYTVTYGNNLVTTIPTCMIIAVDMILPGTLKEIPKDDEQCKSFLRCATQYSIFKFVLNNTFKRSITNLVKNVGGYNSCSASDCGHSLGKCITTVETENYTCYYMTKSCLNDFLNTTGKQYHDINKANTWTKFNDKYKDNQTILICAARGSLRTGCIQYKCAIPDLSGIIIPLMHEDSKMVPETYIMEQTIIIDNKLRRKYTLQDIFHEYTSVQPRCIDAETIGVMYDKETEQVDEYNRCEIGHNFYAKDDLVRCRDIVVNTILHQLLSMQQSRNIAIPSSILLMDNNFSGNMITEYIDSALSCTVIKLDITSSVNADVRF
jgi:hypothetical protein